MKRTLKSISAFSLALLMVLSVSVTVFAANPTITYKGKTEGFTFAPGSEYTSTDLFDNFKNVMPGDKLSETITIQNSANDCDYIKVYMRAVAHDEENNPLTYSEPFENKDGKDQANVEGVRDETVATMSDFLSKLSMRVYDGTSLIYEASPDELDGLTENVHIATLYSGRTASLTVELDVPADLGNKYAYRVGEVDWVFAAEAFDEPIDPPVNPTILTVRKIWVDDGANRPDSVTVNLIKNGDLYASAELNAGNQWTYTWDRLSKNAVWTVEEVDIPDGYEVSYEKSGNVITITNTQTKIPDKPVDPVTPDEPLTLTVNKVWSGDEDQLKNRPDSVGVTLYNGKDAVETVWLGDWNNWSYTWKDLDSSGDWGVLEVTPKGYTPSYSVNGRVITITNTANLIQTGQLNWPVAVLGGIGIVLIVCGCAVIFRKRKNENA